MKRYCAVLIGIWCYVISGVALADNKASEKMPESTIVWRVVDWPPFYILDGSQKNTGLYDSIVEFLIINMPEYQHVKRPMNTSRALYEIKQGKNVCHPSVLPDTQAHLSHVNSFLLPHRVVFNNHSLHDIKKHVDHNGRISLRSLFGSDLHGGVAPGRYSDTINQLIGEYMEVANFSVTPKYDSLVKMLVNRRVDYIIEYDPVVAYFEKVRVIKEPVHSYGITEMGKETFLPVHIGCPNNDWGRKVIADVNRVLSVEFSTPDFLGKRLRWYNDESLNKLRAIYQEYYTLDKSLTSGEHSKHPL